MIIIKGFNKALYETEARNNKLVITAKLPIGDKVAALFPIGDNYGIRTFRNKKGVITRRAWYRKEFPLCYYNEYWAYFELGNMIAELTRTINRIKPFTKGDYITVK